MLSSERRFPNEHLLVGTDRLEEHLGDGDLAPVFSHESVVGS